MTCWQVGYSLHNCVFVEVDIVFSFHWGNKRGRKPNHYSYLTKYVYVPGYWMIFHHRLKGQGDGRWVPEATRSNSMYSTLYILYCNCVVCHCNVWSACRSMKMRIGGPCFQGWELHCLADWLTGIKAKDINYILVCARTTESTGVLSCLWLTTGLLLQLHRHASRSGKSPQGTFISFIVRNWTCLYVYSARQNSRLLRPDRVQIMVKKLWSFWWWNKDVRIRACLYDVTAFKDDATRQALSAQLPQGIRRGRVCVALCLWGSHVLCRILFTFFPFSV